MRKGEAALSAATAAPPWQRDYVRYLVVRIYVIGGRHEEALSLLEPLLTSSTSRVSPGLLTINEDFASVAGGLPCPRATSAPSSSRSCRACRVTAMRPGDPQTEEGSQ